MLTDKMIAALERKGFSRWTKGTMDRLYINARDLGLEVTYGKRLGQVESAVLDGEQLTRSRTQTLLAAKTYINIADGSVHSTVDELARIAEDMLAAVTSEIEAQEEAEAIKAEQDRADAEARKTDAIAAMSDDQLMQTHNRIAKSASGIDMATADAILESLRPYRIEAWNRGLLKTPTIDELPAYTEWLQRARSEYEQAVELGRTHKLAALKNRVNGYEDAIQYVKRMEG